MNNRYCVIMAGGVGSRFWPLSKGALPKQFLDILGTGKSFLRATFERFLPVMPAENFVVVTNRMYKSLVLEHLPELKESQVLCEPMRRNTAPCIAYAAYHIKALCKEAVMVVSPSDHLVTNEAEFQRVVRMGMEYAETHQESLMTIGIRPSRPETGYGYIEVQPDEGKETKVVSMNSFKEKPDLATAERFYRSGNYLWNSGIFVWQMNGIMKAFKEQLPSMVSLFDEGVELFGTEREQTFIDERFGECENISIDYGVMERATERFTIPADFGWSDIGTYGSLYEHSKKDDEGNLVRGRAVVEQCRRSVVAVEEGVEAIVEGLEDALVVYKGGSLLVCKMSEEQRIKEWVAKLESV